MHTKPSPITSFAGKVAFVTGAASGIGLSLSKALLKRGASVMMADLDLQKLESARAELSGDVRSVVCNVADMQAVADAAQVTNEAFGKVHMLFNNAGVNVTGSAEDTRLEDWRWAVDINLMGVVHGVDAFLPLLLAHDEGAHIVNTSSVAGHFAPRRGVIYSATKFAVVGLSEALRKDLKQQGIGVSVLCPGWVATNFHQTEMYRPSGEAPALAARTHPDALDAKALMANGISPDRVAELTLDSILDNRSHIFTSRDASGLLERRYDTLSRRHRECMLALE